jgi:DNA processing protein
VVTPPPWIEEGFDGSRKLLDEGARPLRTIRAFLVQLGLAPPGHERGEREGGERERGERERGGRSTPLPHPSRGLSSSETAVLRATSSAPLHLDEIASRAALAVEAVAAALLTLALENVVVEGPPGFFRRRDG